jgi:hypothetical protein
VEHLRSEVLEFIEVAIVELKGMAQPRDIAELRELAMDVRDADSEDAIVQIRQQAQNLREFCEKRSKSTGKFPSVFPPPGRKRVD